MKSNPILLGIGCLMLLISNGRAATFFVNLNSTNPVSPYTNWVTAATNIQDAIDAATTGDMVLVTNGIYSIGGRFSDGATNCVYLNKAIAVQSVNGPWATTIVGAYRTRPAWLTNGASLTGFTLTNGYVGGSGGGVWCSSSNAVVANCVIVFNSATVFGGGIYRGTCNNCFISENSVSSAGSAAYGAWLNNCTVSGNTIRPAVNACALTNCIVQNNTAGNYSSSKFSFCCTTPAAPGDGNFTDDPGFFVDGIHLTNGSPCIGTGTNVAAVGTDIFGNSWSNPPSVGCAEWQPAPYVPKPQLQYTNQPIGFSISVPPINGVTPISVWWIKDGTPLQDDSHFNFTQTTNLAATGARFSDSGNYQLVASNSFGITTGAVARVTIHAVDINSTNPIAPYASLATAATNIQDAIDEAVPGEIILVADGIYNAGGKLISSTSNRVALDKPVTVVSVNGYAHTIIQGAWDPVYTNGPAAIRCVYLTTNALLKGFTLENGATPSGNFAAGVPDSGGGVFCVGSNAIVSNCLLTNNSAIYGGGICNGTLNNSLVVGNYATSGSGAYGGTLNNCTVIENVIVLQSAGGSSDAIVGTYGSTVRNSIVLYNLKNYQGMLLAGGNYSGGSFSFSLSYPLPLGPGNLDVNPQFLDLFHIALTSQCFGTGNTAFASGTDLDGEPWLNPPSMGCDEVVISNLVGPLSVSFIPFHTNWVTIENDAFWGTIVGRASRAEWSFDDGSTVTNVGVNASHTWTNAGDYTVTFTAYNSDYPSGVSTDLTIHIAPFPVPQLQSAIWTTNGFQFQFLGVTNPSYIVQYTIQYATNLATTVAWQTLQNVFYYYYYGGNNLVQITDSQTNAVRFYRVLAQ
jgi:hypothetical protein